MAHRESKTGFDKFFDAQMRDPKFAKAYKRERARIDAARGSRSSDEPMLDLTSFDQWVGANNIPKTFEYSKGWWDYVELVQRWAKKFGVRDATVVGHYVVRTPPPEEQLPMPAVLLVRDGVSVALRFDFGHMRKWPLEWTVSVRRRSPYAGPTFDIFDANLDLRGERIEGFSPDWVFGPYRENPAEFTCELEDEWDVATLLRLVFHEP
jgi:hypothetical protein